MHEGSSDVASRTTTPTYLTPLRRGFLLVHEVSGFEILTNAVQAREHGRRSNAHVAQFIEDHVAFAYRMSMASNIRMQKLSSMPRTCVSMSSTLDRSDTPCCGISRSSTSAIVTWRSGRKTER